MYARQLDGKTVTVVMNGTGKAQTLNMNIYKDVLPERQAYDVISGKHVTIKDEMKVPRRGMFVLEFKESMEVKGVKEVKEVEDVS